MASHAVGKEIGTELVHKSPIEKVAHAAQQTHSLSHAPQRPWCFQTNGCLWVRDISWKKRPRTHPVEDEFNRPVLPALLSSPCLPRAVKATPGRVRNNNTTSVSKWEELVVLLPNRRLQPIVPMRLFETNLTPSNRAVGQSSWRPTRSAKSEGRAHQRPNRGVVYIPPKGYGSIDPP